MLQEIIKYVLKQDTSEQLDELYDGLVGASGLGSAQGVCTGQALDEMIAAATTEMNQRSVRN